MVESKEAKRDKWAFIENLDRRYLSLIVLIAVSMSILIPLGLPISINDETINVYQYIENLPEGSNVFLSFDASIRYWSGETMPTAEAVVQHLLRRPVKIVMAGFRHVDGPVLADQTIRKMDTMNKIYGQDYVNMGYFALQTGMAAFAKGIHSLAKTDFYDTPLDELPLMENIDTMEDFTVIIVFTTYGDITQQIQQWNAPYGTPLIGVGSTRIGPSSQPYRATGQVVGLLATGVRAGAEYESLLKITGRGLLITDALSVSLLTVTCLIVIGNIPYFVKKFGGGNK